jgi:hypothetical protein
MPAPRECPVCGAKDQPVIVKKKDIFVPMGAAAHQLENILRCNQCGAKVRIASESQETVEDRIWRRSIASIPKMVETVNKAGYTNERVEKAFDLDKGILVAASEWWKLENMEPDMETACAFANRNLVGKYLVALLRLVASNPKLVEFAEEGFETTSPATREIKQLNNS